MTATTALAPPTAAPSTARHMPIRGDREAISYRELDAWSARIAVRLAARGVGRGSRVLVLAGSCAGAVAAVLGAQRIGAAHAAVDPACSDRLIADAAADCDAVVATADGAAARWLAAGLAVVRADECRAEAD